MDFYNILNIKKDATQEEIKHAYIKLAKIYHPDKNKSSDSHNKFIEINTAYEILYNNKTNKNYSKMSDNDKLDFNDFINKIINLSEVKLIEIEKYFNKLCKKDLEYIKNNFVSFIKKINIIELFDIFNNGKINKKNYLTYSDTESEINIEYYYILPIYIQKNNDNDIKIDLPIELDDIINNSKKKIKIKRKNNSDIIISTFIFNLSHPYIVFYEGGDICDNIIGNLIIKIILPNNIYWNNDILFIDYPMTLYELIYGIDININNIIMINQLIPYKNGFSIDISIENYINIIIKLCLIYEDNNENKEILKKIL